MSFEIGQTVVYPHHGAAKIEEISTRVIRGEEKTYLTLRVSQGDLTIQVPAENVDLVGVRDVVDEDGLETVLSRFCEPPTLKSPRTGHVVSKPTKRRLPLAISSRLLRLFEILPAVMIRRSFRPERSAC